jgi:hypothetical protein
MHLLHLMPYDLKGCPYPHALRHDWYGPGATGDRCLSHRLICQTRTGKGSPIYGGRRLCRWSDTLPCIHSHRTMSLAVNSRGISPRETSRRPPWMKIHRCLALTANEHRECETQAYDWSADNISYTKARVTFLAKVDVLYTPALQQLVWTSLFPLTVNMVAQAIFTSLKEVELVDLCKSQPGAIISCFAALCLLAWRLWRFTIQPLMAPNDPKELPYWIPVLGKILLC